MVFIQLLLIFPALLVAFYGWGSLLNRAFFPSRWYKLPLATNIALGMGMVGYVTFFFGHLGLIHIITGWIILTIGVMLSTIWLLKGGPKWHLEFQLDRSVAHFVTFGIWMGLSLFALWGSLSPEIDYDALHFHLSMPRCYIEAGKIFPTPYSVHSNFSNHQLMLYLWTLLLGNLSQGDLLCRLLQWSQLILGSIFIYQTGKLIRNSLTGWLAACLSLGCILGAYYRVPLFCRSDIATYMFVAAGLLHWVSYLKSKETNSLYVAGIFAGFAVSTKYTAIPFFFIPVVIGSLFLIRSVKPALIISICMLVVFSPWAIRNLVNTGNPLYPLFDNIFPIKQDYRMPLEQLTVTPGPMDKLQLGTFLNELFSSYKSRLNFAMTEGDFLILPFLLLSMLFLFNKRKELRAFGIAGVFCNLFLVCLLVGQGSRYYLALVIFNATVLAVILRAGTIYKKALVCITTFALFLLLLLAQWKSGMWTKPMPSGLKTHWQVQRYFLITTPFSALLLAVALHWLCQKTRWKTAFIVLVPLIVTAIVFQHQWHWTKDTGLLWYKPYFTRTSRWNYIKTLAPDVKSLAAAYKYIKTSLSENAYILCVKHPYAFYLPRRYITNDARSPELFTFLFRRFHSIDRIPRYMKDNGITHVLQNGDARSIPGFNEFKRRYLNLIYQDSNAKLFSLQKVD